MSSSTTESPALTEQRDALVRQTVATVWERSEFYRSRLQEAGVEPGDIATVADLERVPILLRKDDERRLQEDSRSTAGHSFGEHLCVDPAEVISVASTSGTTGAPTFYAFTAEDVAVTDELGAGPSPRRTSVPAASSCTASGSRCSSPVFPLRGRWSGTSTQIVPVGAEAGTKRLLDIAALVRPDALLCTPSYASYLIEQAPEQMREFGLRSIVSPGTRRRPAEIRSRIEEATGATVYDVLGEPTGSSTLPTEHGLYEGMTVLGDDCSVDKLGTPKNRALLPIPDDGTPAYGERVKTTLRWRAQPQLRSSVGDVYEMRRVPGPDGRLETRIKVIGRTDDLLSSRASSFTPPPPEISWQPSPRG